MGKHLTLEFSNALVRTVESTPRRRPTASLEGESRAKTTYADRFGKYPRPPRRKTRQGLVTWNLLPGYRLSQDSRAAMPSSDERTSFESAALD